MCKKLRIASACAVIYLLSFGLGAALTGTGEGAVEATEISEAAVTETTAVSYIIKEREGCVAVYDGITGEVAVKTDIPVSSLRTGDRQMVEQGIEAENYDEVLCLLEDLGS